jgi:hypothetical protein
MGPMENRRRVLTQMLHDGQQMLPGRCYVMKSGGELCGCVAMATSDNPQALVRLLQPVKKGVPRIGVVTLVQKN